jgi:exonuclease V gamma subunit
MARDCTITLAPATNAAVLLDVLVQGVRAIYTSPVPYFLEAAFMYRDKVDKGIDVAVQAAHDTYHKEPGDFGPGGDGCNEYVQLLWRGRDPVAEFTNAFCQFADAFWTPFEELVAE